ncbi:UNVERIFIED_CONTAM: hypothetical protein FKN15_017733 [Acipenser sinensis]
MDGFQEKTNTDRNGTEMHAEQGKKTKTLEPRVTSNPSNCISLNTIQSDAFRKHSANRLTVHSPSS